jgi:hypothetical protein
MLFLKGKENAKKKVKVAAGLLSSQLTSIEGY